MSLVVYHCTCISELHVYVYVYALQQVNKHILRVKQKE